MWQWHGKVTPGVWTQGRKASQERHPEKATWQLRDGGHTGTGQAKSREHGIQGCCELRPVGSYCVPDLIPGLCLVISLEPSQKYQGCRASPIVDMSKARLRVAGELAQSTQPVLNLALTPGTKATVVL